MNYEELMANIQYKGVELYDDVDEKILSPFSMTPQRKLEIVVVNGAMLGISGGDFTYNYLCETALRSGMKICPPEVAFHIALQEIHIPKLTASRSIGIAMHPIKDVYGRNYIFALGEHFTDEAITIGAQTIDEENPRYHPNDPFFIFCR